MGIAILVLNLRGAAHNLSSMGMHWHKCCVYECCRSISCKANCVGDDIPETPCCPEHSTIWRAIQMAVGPDIKLLQIFQTGLPVEFISGAAGPPRVRERYLSGVNLLS